jgi:hypothetical protein
MHRVVFSGGIRTDPLTTPSNLPTAAEADERCSVLRNGLHRAVKL